MLLNNKSLQLINQDTSCSDCSKENGKRKTTRKVRQTPKEAHALSTTNRKLSDEKVFEAEEIMKKSISWIRIYEGKIPQLLPWIVLIKISFGDLQS